MFKKFGKKSIGIIALAAILSLTLVLGSCLPKKFQSDTEYLQYVEAQAFENAASDIADVYDMIVSGSEKSDANGGTVAIDLELSDEALNMIELMAEIDLSWLSNIGIDISGCADGDVTGLDMALSLGESELITLDAIFDMANGKIYATIPEILAKYLAVDLSDMGLDMATLDMAKSIDFEGLPEGKELEELLDKYIDLALGCINSVEKAEGSLIANGVEEKCSVLTIKITEDDAEQMVNVVLGTARQDPDLKSVIVKFGDWMAKTSADFGESADITGESLYADFCEALDEMLEDIPSDIYDTSAETGDTSSEEDALIITDYINSDDEIIGRTIGSGDDELLSYGFASGKDGFGFELKVEGETLIIGQGTSGKKLNGTFTLTEGNIDYLTLTVEDLDMGKLENGYISGAFELAIDELPEDTLPSFVSSILSVYTLRIEMDTSKDGGKMVLAVMSGENYFAKLTLEAKAEKIETPAVPSEDNTIIISEDMDYTALLSEIDFDVLLEKLRNSSIPEDYVTTIEQYIAILSMYG